MHLQRPWIRKPKLLRSNPHRFISIKVQGSDPSELLIDDEYIIVQRQYNSLLKAPIENELSDYIKLRLFLARRLAMKKYNETCG